MRKMIRRCTLLTLLVALFSALGGCALPGGATPTPVATPIPSSQAITATLRTYYDPNAYFTIGYPPDWKVSEADQQVEFIEPYGQLHILVQYADAGQVLDETMMRTLIDGYFATEESAGVSDFARGRETVYSDGSIRVEYTFTVAGTPGYGSSLFQQEGTFLYILSFWVERQDLWAANQAFFDTVAGTLMLTPHAK